jgi:cation transport regulator ChaB
MSEIKDNDVIQAHKRFAVELFNHTWELYDKKERSRSDDEEMLNSAHASAYHWSQLKDVIGEERYKQSFPRAEYLISRVNWALGNAEASLRHAERSLEYCEEYGIADFDLAFAYEALARAHSLTGNQKERDRYVELAKKASDDIKKKEEKDAFLSELASVPSSPS